MLERAVQKDSTEALSRTKTGSKLQVHRGRSLPTRSADYVEASETLQHSGSVIQTETAYTEWYNQGAGIVYENVCTEYGQRDHPMSGWEIPQKAVEDKKAKSL